MTKQPLDLDERYVLAWNEADPEVRRVELEALYSDRGCIVTQSSESNGIDEVIAHVGHVFEQFIGTGRYVFRSGGSVRHHQCVLFRWEMVDAASGELADAGMNLFLLTADGRVEDDYQFALGIDSSIGSSVRNAS
jgi:hypothetical protein